LIFLAHGASPVVKPQKKRLPVLFQPERDRSRRAGGRPTLDSEEPQEGPRGRQKPRDSDNHFKSDFSKRNRLVARDGPTRGGCDPPRRVYESVCLCLAGPYRPFAPAPFSRRYPTVHLPKTTMSAGVHQPAPTPVPLSSGSDTLANARRLSSRPASLVENSSPQTPIYDPQTRLLPRRSVRRHPHNPRPNPRKYRPSRTPAQRPHARAKRRSRCPHVIHKNHRHAPQSPHPTSRRVRPRHIPPPPPGRR